MDTDPEPGIWISQSKQTNRAERSEPMKSFQVLNQKAQPKPTVHSYLSWQEWGAENTKDLASIPPQAIH